RAGRSARYESHRRFEGGIAGARGRGRARIPGNPHSRDRACTYWNIKTVAVLHRSPRDSHRRLHPARRLVELTVAARSDVGMIRSGNEDSFYAHANKETGLFIVADGMGGHAAGEVASEMAVQIVSRELAPLADLHSESARNRVAESIRVSNRAIYERTIAESDKQGMGTTVSLLVLSGSRFLIGQVGDS